MAYNFIKKDNTRSTARADVSIRINKGGTKSGNAKRVVIRFELEAVKKLSAKSAYLIAGIDPELERVGFMEDGPLHGYKLTWTSIGRQKMQISFPFDQDKKFTDYVGDYQLLYDKDQKLYYVDKKRMLS